MEQDGVVHFVNNKASKFHGICMVKLKIFDDCEFLLYIMRYVPKLENFLLISMFDDLVYCTRVEHGALNISQGEVILTRGSKICGLYILEGVKPCFVCVQVRCAFGKVLLMITT